MIVLKALALALSITAAFYAWMTYPRRPSGNSFVLMEELGERRLRRLMEENPGDILPLGKWVEEFRIERSSWSFLKRLAWRVGLVTAQ